MNEINPLEAYNQHRVFKTVKIQPFKLSDHSLIKLTAKPDKPDNVDEVPNGSLGNNLDVLD